MSHITQSAADNSSGSSTTSNGATTAGGENKHQAHIRHIIEATLWIIGVIVLFTFAVLTRAHKGPWPGEVAFSRAVQAIHYPAWLLTMLTFFSTANDIPPSIAAVTVLFFFMLIMRWFKQAIFFLLTVCVGNGINILIGDFVLRPRPSAKLIHVDTPLLFNSFPSGHTEHVVVFLGFLFYLTLTKSVREWRYHWLLLPFQIYAVVTILAIGYSRILEGEHWLTDVLGGYLSGALWLFLFIFLYRWTTNKLAQRRAQNEIRLQRSS